MSLSKILKTENKSKAFRFRQRLRSSAFTQNFVFLAIIQHRAPANTAICRLACVSYCFLFNMHLWNTDRNANYHYVGGGLPRCTSGKEPTCQCGRHKRCGFAPLWGEGRSPGGGHGNPLQYSCLENPTYRGAWWAIVHGVAESNTTESTKYRCTM